MRRARCSVFEGIFALYLLLQSLRLLLWLLAFAAGFVSAFMEVR